MLTGVEVSVLPFLVWIPSSVWGEERRKWGTPDLRLVCWQVGSKEMSRVLGPKRSV